MKPLTWLGAPAPGGLSLPDAKPAPCQFYAPRGVYGDDRCLVVADTGNHRVLIWHDASPAPGQPADVVLGQPDFHSEGAKLLRLPTGVAVIQGRLVVADAWHHRLLIWDTVPVESKPPDVVIGQTSLEGVEPNAGGAICGHAFLWPFAFAWAGSCFWVADTGNRRVLGWQGWPEPGRGADFVLGQDGFTQGEENRGGPVSLASFRWPHSLASSGETLYVADAGNHRVLGWRQIPKSTKQADFVLGQPAGDQAFELPYCAQGPSKMRFPYAVSADEGHLAVADTANNRVLWWNGAPQTTFAPADAVLGQLDFAANGENRWKAVLPDTLCWPYGIWLHRGRLAVADSGNNRIMIWDVTATDASREEVEHPVCA